jgi:hypothetical protein
MLASKLYQLIVKTPSGDYQGCFHSPQPEKRLTDALASLNGFLNLTDVTVTQTGEQYPFVIVNMKTIETIILLSEKEGVVEEE